MVSKFGLNREETTVTSNKLVCSSQIYDFQTEKKMENGQNGQKKKTKEFTSSTIFLNCEVKLVLGKNVMKKSSSLFILSA